MTPEERRRLNDVLVQLGWVRRALRRVYERLDRPTWEGLATARKEASEYGAQLEAAIRELEALARGEAGQPAGQARGA
ncbi:MAG TPA: hypothetical protein VFB73_17890 [Chloroflexota bacterium]|jgi:DNA-binding FrmR family transcriptional regulator|nr:hypothetical protein [Chloroflexota bacterium]